MRVLLLALCLLMGLGLDAKACDRQLVLREGALARDFQKSGRHFGIPYQLLMAIARQESACQPLVINIAGKDYYPRTLQQALDLVAQAQSQKQSFDLGLMQINAEWLTRFGLSPKLLLEPKNNIFMGAYILSREIRRRGFGWEAIGHYHSHSKARARDYAGKIKGHLGKVLVHWPKRAVEGL
ncbi:MAG: lytic transglycosylase domain-containing protein [Desulfovibrio sp.]|nr:lytic transglycosylase domain-containing protein [Desulfovibrio sp.]